MSWRRAVPDIEEYLGKIRASLRLDPGRAEEICGELASHLEAEVLELQQTGLAREGAMDSAIRSLGDPGDIARELTKANHRYGSGGREMAKRLVIWTAVALLVAASAAFVRHQDAIEKRALTPLHYAAMNGRTEEVERRLAGKADAKATVRDGSRLLSIAAGRGHADIVRVLLAHGADASAPAEFCWTPLHAAAYARSAEATQLLLAHGANVNAWDKYWDTPLHIAAAQGCPEVVELLLAHGAVPRRDRLGWTPLHSAALNDNPKIVAALLEAGAKVNVRTSPRFGCVTPLRLARSAEVIQLLRKHGGTL